MVLVVVTYWITCSGTFQCNFEIIIQGVLCIKTNHFCTRDHNLSGGSIRKFKNVIHERHLSTIDQPALAALLHHNPDLLFSEKRIMS
ncbi:hypothetical protein D3C81_1765950 [compost metagenome]